MNRKGKSLNIQCFYRNNKIFCGIKSYNTCSNAVFRHWHSPTIGFVTRLLMIRWSKSTQKSAVLQVSSRWCCYGNHTAGS